MMARSYTSLPLEQWQQAWQTLDSATKTATRENSFSRKVA